MDKRWKTNKGCVFNVSYHLIWCPKYRRKLLVGEVENMLKELLLSKAEDNGWTIEQIEVMPDHVHLFIKTTPSDSIAYIVSQLKGFTAFKLRREFTRLKTQGTPPCGRALATVRLLVIYHRIHHQVHRRAEGEGEVASSQKGTHSSNFLRHGVNVNNNRKLNV